MRPAGTSTGCFAAAIASPAGTVIAASRGCARRIASAPSAARRIAERVGRALRLGAGGEQPGEQVEAVGEREQRARQRRPAARRRPSAASPSRAARCATSGRLPRRAAAYSRAMTPARLDSSTTISVARSNFASSPARASVGALLGGQVDGARRARPASAAIRFGPVVHRAELVGEGQLAEPGAESPRARPAGRRARRTPRPRTGPGARPRCRPDQRRRRTSPLATATK